MCTPCTAVSRSDSSRGQVGAVHPHPDGEVLGGGVELVQVVLPLVEVVAHLLVRHRDRSRPGAGAAAVGEPVLGGGRQLGGGQPVAPVQVDHRPGERRVGVDDVGDLGRVDVDAEVAVHRHLAQFGDQPGVVLRGEERRVDAEHLGDAQQHGDGQRADVVLDLVQVARGDVEHLGQRGLAESALAAELAHPRSDEGLGHVDQHNEHCEGAFAVLARAVARGSIWTREYHGQDRGTGLAKSMMPVPDPHPDVFDIEWPLRVADVDRDGQAEVRRRHPAHPGRRLRPAARDGLRGDPSAVDRPSHDDRPDRAHRVQGHAAAAALVFGHVQPVV